MLLHCPSLPPDLAPMKPALRSRVRAALNALRAEARAAGLCVEEVRLAPAAAGRLMHLHPRVLVSSAPTAVPLPPFSALAAAHKKVGPACSIKKSVRPQRKVSLTLQDTGAPASQGCVSTSTSGCATTANIAIQHASPHPLATPRKGQHVHVTPTVTSAPTGRARLLETGGNVRATTFAKQPLATIAGPHSNIVRPQRHQQHLLVHPIQQHSHQQHLTPLRPCIPRSVPVPLTKVTSLTSTMQTHTQTRDDDDDVNKRGTNADELERFSIPESHVKLFLSSVATIKAREEATKQRNQLEQLGQVERLSQPEPHEYAGTTTIPYEAITESAPVVTTVGGNGNERLVISSSRESDGASQSPRDDEPASSPTPDQQQVAEHHQQQQQENDEKVSTTPSTSPSSGSPSSSSTLPRRAISKQHRRRGRGSLPLHNTTNHNNANNNNNNNNNNRVARPFRCSLCPSSFDRDGHLRVHILAVHEKKRPFVCRMCDASFGHSSSLLRHVRTVHQARPPVGPARPRKQRRKEADGTRVGVAAHRQGQRQGQRHREEAEDDDEEEEEEEEEMEEEEDMDVEECHFRCNVCNETFSRVALLNRHVAQRHPITHPDPGQTVDEVAQLVSSE